MGDAFSKSLSIYKEGVLSKYIFATKSCLDIFIA